MIEQHRLEDLFDQVYREAGSRGKMISFVTAGGGAELYRIFQIPGISKIMVDARMLYHLTSFEAFLGREPSEKVVSQRMADDLAQKLAQVSSAEICLAVTSALQTNRHRKGADQGYLSIVEQGQIVLQQHFSLEGDSRQEQDIEVSISALTALSTLLRSPA